MDITRFSHRYPMPVLDSEQLKTFIAVIDAGSLTAAAPRVFLSQSAVSEQMRKLEARVGVPLFTRSKSGVAATAAGERLAVYAQQIVALSDRAMRDLHDDALAGELRLGVTDYFRPGDLATLLSRLNGAYPQLRLHVTVLKSGAIEAGYAAGDFDVGLTMRILHARAAASVAPLRKQKATKTSHSLRRERLVWMGATGLAPERDQPMRLLVLPDTCSLHQFTIKRLRAARVPFTVAHVASGVAGLQSALAAGLGVACLNESALCEGVAALASGHKLPALPAVEFQLLEPRHGESGFVTRARDMLAEQMA